MFVVKSLYILLYSSNYKSLIVINFLMPYRRKLSL